MLDKNERNFHQRFKKGHGGNERISSYVKQYTLSQLVEYLTKDGSFGIQQDTITASLIKLKDETAKNNI